MLGHMTMMIRSVRNFIKVFLRNASKKCEEIPKIVLLGPHDHVGGVTLPMLEKALEIP